MKLPLSVGLFLLCFLGSWRIPSATSPDPDTSNIPSLSKRTAGLRNKGGTRPASKLAEIAKLQDPAVRLQHLTDLASSIPVNQLKDWLTPTNPSLLDPSLRSLFLTITCDRWLEAEPSELILWNAFAELVDTPHYLARWLMMDRDAATTHILCRPTGSPPARSMSQAIQNLVKADFDLAFDLTKNQLSNDEDLNPALLALANHDLQAFITLSETLPRKLQPKITPSIVASLLPSDFQEALSHLTTRVDGTTKLLAAGDILGKQAFADALFDNLDQLPGGWLQKILDDSYLAKSTKSLPWLELGPARLGITPTAFGKLLTYRGGTRFGLENHPRILTILNNPDIPFESRSTFLYSQWGQIPYDQFALEFEQINNPKLRSKFLETRAAFE